jgi:hypothetical protein
MMEDTVETIVKETLIIVLLSSLKSHFRSQFNVMFDVSCASPFFHLFP